MADEKGVKLPGSAGALHLFISMLWKIFCFIFCVPFIIITVVNALHIDFPVVNPVGESLPEKMFNFYIPYGAALHSQQIIVFIHFLPVDDKVQFLLWIRSSLDCDSPLNFWRFGRCFSEKDVPRSFPHIFQWFHQNHKYLQTGICGFLKKSEMFRLSECPGNCFQIYRGGKKRRKESSFGGISIKLENEDFIDYLFFKCYNWKGLQKQDWVLRPQPKWEKER